MSKTVLITGGMNGIGFHTAKELLSMGYRVCVIDLSQQNLDVLKKSGGENFMFFRCDITDMSALNFCVEKLAHEWRKIDILVNNAGRAIYKEFEYRRDEELREEIEVNYFGTVNAIRAVFPFMKKRGSGIIHNVASFAGENGFERMSGYASSKGALEALTKTLAMEFAKYGVCVNVIYLPWVKTKPSEAPGIPAKMMQTPEEAGKKLANRIESRKKFIFPDFKTAFFTGVTHLFPYFSGGFFSKAAYKNRV